MTLKKHIGLLLLALLSLAPTAGAQKTTTTFVTSTVYDNDASGTQLLFRSDDYNAADQATYTTMKSKGAGYALQSLITNGEWQLAVGSTSLRAVWITPDAAIDTTQPPAPPAGFYTNVEIRSQCFDPNGNSVPFPNVVTSSGLCKVGMNFDSGGSKYKLLMSPFPLSGAGDPPPTCPSTGCPAPAWANVTCNAVSNNQCVDWTIVPNATLANANVANLYRYVASKNSATWLFIGQYYNTYRINVTNP